MHASFCSDLVKRCLLLNRQIRSSFRWVCCWHIVGWRTLVSNALHSYSKCCQQGLGHHLPITIKCLHCNANITLQFTTVKGRDREGQTFIYAQIMVFWDGNLANITIKMEAAAACKVLVSIHRITWSHIPEVSLLWELQCQKFVAKSELNNNQHSYKTKPSWLDEVCPVREAVTHITREKKTMTFSLKL